MIKNDTYSFTGFRYPLIVHNTIIWNIILLGEKGDENVAGYLFITSKI